MSHPKVASTAEPWILLPLVYMQKNDGILTEYSHSICSRAINDFIFNLPQKNKDYIESLNQLMTTLYCKQCKNGESYFLDKTPRYYLIIKEIVEIFPNAKIIFLFRNPVQIFSSIVQTWSSGNFRKIYKYNMDLYRGQKLLSEGYSNLIDKSLLINYEDFILNPEKFMRKTCKFLDIEYSSKLLKSFAKQKTKGRFGDPTGTINYQEIERESLSKWKKVVTNRYRLNIIKKYVNSLDSDYLKIQGYNKNKIIGELEKIKPKRYFSLLDFIHVTTGNIILKYNLLYFFGKHTSKILKYKLLT